MRKNTKKISKIILSATTILIAGFLAFPVFAYEPSVQTLSYGSVSGGCAMLRGSTNTNNTSNYSRWFEIKDVNKNMQPIKVGQSWSFYSNGNSNMGNYQSEAQNLTPDTDYVYRAVAQNSEGISYGNEISFRTKSIEYVTMAFLGCSEYVPMTTNRNVIVDVNTGAVIPMSSPLNQGSQTASYATPNQTSYTGSGASYQTVTSAYATNIGSASATLTAYVHPTQNIVEYGKFLWGRSSGNLANVTPRVALGSGASLTLSQQIYGLTSGTTYYYEPVIDNQFGTTAGSVLSFTTLGNAPLGAGQVDITNNDSGYIAYNSTPTGRKIVSTTNPNPSFNSSQGGINNTDTNTANNVSAQNNNLAAVTFSGNSYSIFPKTFTDWFAIISLLFLVVLAYVSWKFYIQKKEDELEYATVPEILTDVDVNIVPQKSEQLAFLPKKYIKDPLCDNSKEDMVPNTVINTVKSAPPDNLPI